MSSPPPKPENPLHLQMTTQLHARKQKSSFRTLTLPSKSSIDFSSNSFLSLHNSPLLRTAFLRELSTFSPSSSFPSHHAKDWDFPLGSSASRLLDGNSSYAEDLEKEIAGFHKADSGLLFNSGYDANTAFFGTVPQRGDAGMI